MVSTAAQSDPRTAGYQRWRLLTFLHWRVAPETLQALLPSGLQIQQFDGSAWLGVVPFSMERVRPWWSPAIPGVSWFLETNVRTYVVDERGVAGVWFFSLDANSRLAVNLARTVWHLPYKLAAILLDVNRTYDHAGPAQIRYAGLRKEDPAAQYELTINLPHAEPKPAELGTLAHFLVERYLLFATDRKQRLRSGRVHHQPYRIVTPISIVGTQSLTSAIGCDGLEIASADHTAFCQGVDVRVSPLKIGINQRHGAGRQ